MITVLHRARGAKPPAKIFWYHGSTRILDQGLWQAHNDDDDFDYDHDYGDDFIDIFSLRCKYNLYDIYNDGYDDGHDDDVMLVKKTHFVFTCRPSTNLQGSIKAQEILIDLSCTLDLF